MQADHLVTAQCSSRKGPGRSYGLLCDSHITIHVRVARKLLPLKVETLRLVHHKHHNWFAWQYCAGSGRTTRLSYFIVEVLSSHVLHLLIISMENNAYPQPHLTTNLSPGNLSYVFGLLEETGTLRRDSRDNPSLFNLEIKAEVLHLIT